MSHNAFKDY